MKSSRVCWRPGPSGFSRNKYTQHVYIMRLHASILAAFHLLRRWLTRVVGPRAAALLRHVHAATEPRAASIAGRLGRMFVRVMGPSAAVAAHHVPEAPEREHSAERLAAQSHLRRSIIPSTVTRRISDGRCDPRRSSGLRRLRHSEPPLAAAAGQSRLASAAWPRRPSRGRCSRRWTDCRPSAERDRREIAERQPRGSREAAERQPSRERAEREPRESRETAEREPRESRGIAERQPRESRERAEG